MPYPLAEHQTWWIFDSSKVKQFMDCPRHFFYRYVLGWESEQPNVHLVFGEAMHRGLEHLLLHGHDEESVKAAYEKAKAYYDKELGQTTEDYTPKTPAGAFSLLAGYASHYNHNELQVLHTEVCGTVLISEDQPMHFRLDAIVRDDRGVWILEHKTAGRADSNWHSQWTQSMQVGTYLHALYCLYDHKDVMGLLLNGLIIKRATKADLSSSLPVGIGFVRVPIRKTIDTMSDWLWNCNHWVNWIKFEYERLAQCDENCQVLHCFPKNTENCTKYFGCPYLDYCTVWANPLQHIHALPPGMALKYWDPREKEKEVAKDVYTNLSR